MSSLFTSGARLALAAALGSFALGSATATAADLGGNCCADLEERIAELEATTARKGNRKVSLTISGWVNEAVMFWDDGVESNVYVGTNSLEQSRFKLAGEAKIDGDWSAGYTMEFGVTGGNLGRVDQDTDNGDTNTNTVSVRKSSWFLKSKTLGKITVGQDGTSTYHLLDDADGVNTRSFSDAEAAAVAQARFKLRSGGGLVGSLRWTDVMRGFNNSTPGQNGRRNIVRYDSPEFMGFVASASWGEDDQWDTALSYKGELGDFKLVGKVGYGHATDDNSNSGCSQSATAAAAAGLAAGTGVDCEWWGIAGTVMHKPTGLFVYGGYGEQRDDTEAAVVIGGTAAQDKDATWFIQAGIEQKFIPLGKTTVFGEYRSDDAGSNIDTGKTIGGSLIHNSDLNFWAAGVVQSVDAAAMDLYVIYRHADGDVTTFAGGTTALDDFDMVLTGARIQF